MMLRPDTSGLAERFAEEAAAIEAAGFRATRMKVGPGPRADIELVRAVRGALRPETRLMVDANHCHTTADALQVVHDAGVVHRDIKPSNILLDGGGNPKVADFGLAQVEDALALSRTGDFAGTPYYMSPEQAAARRIGIDHRTDVFSLGVTLYETLTLSRPFEGDTSQEVLEKILMDDPPEPRRLRARMPRDLSVICLKAMQKKRDRRYPSMRAFAEDLQRFLAGETIRARAPSRTEKAARWMRRHPSLSAVIATVLVALVVVSGLLASNLRLQERQFVYAARGTLEELEEAVPRLLRAGYGAEEEFRAWRERGEWLLEQRPELERRRATLGAGGGSADHVVQAAGSTLQSLLQRMEAFYDEDSAIGAGRGAFRELIRVRQASLSSTSARARWKEARSAGLAVAPRAGLLPLERDPGTGLWELVDLYTGGEPQRGTAGELIFDGTEGVVFVVIPAGGFWMGAQSEDELGPNYDNWAYPDESPVHWVELDSFLLGKTEVTNGQYLRVMGVHPDGEEEVEDRLPVSRLDWQTSVSYLAILGLVLPEESQWEYACRAGTETRYWSGNEDQDLARVGWYSWNAWVRLRGVGEKSANPFGLHDMHGNVAEWCRDEYEKYGEDSIEGSEEERVVEGSGLRVYRGGGFADEVRDVRSSYRYGDYAAYHSRFLGFRAALRY